MSPLAHKTLQNHSNFEEFQTVDLMLEQSKFLFAIEFSSVEDRHFDKKLSHHNFLIFEELKVSSLFNQSCQLWIWRCLLKIINSFGTLNNPGPFIHSIVFQQFFSPRIVYLAHRFEFLLIGFNDRDIFILDFAKTCFLLLNTKS